MLKNYLKIALRNLAKYKVYSTINILGLALGLTAGLLLTLFLVDELTFDRFHSKADRIYRLVLNADIPGQGSRRLDVAPGALAPALAQDFLEIEGFTQLSMLGRADITFENNSYYETLLVADDSLFELFDFAFLQGDSETSLREPGSVAITEETATKYFGSDDPIGKMFQSNRGEFRVTAILENLPTNSHLQFNMLFALSDEMRARISGWDNFNFYSYSLSNENASIENVEERLPEFVQDRLPDQIKDLLTLSLQLLTDIHFGSADIDNSLSTNSGSTSAIYSLSGIAFFILFIACINYINLATARAVSRAKEIGLRKVVGAQRGQLVFQFLCESVLLTLLAFLIALLATLLLLSVFNSFTGKFLSFAAFGQSVTGLAVLGMAALIGLAAGVYPAVYLANIKTAANIAGRQGSGGSSLNLRRGLVVTQFAMSVVLLIATFVAMQQINFIRNQPLGFDSESLVVIDINSGFSRQGYAAIKSEFLNNPAVLSVSVSSRVPGEWKNILEIPVRRPGQTVAQSQLPSFIGVDADFLSTFSIDLLLGRNFRTGLSTGSPTGSPTAAAESSADTNSVLVNESLMQLMGWQTGDVLGQQIPLSDRSGESFVVTVIGVVADFHFRSLHEEIGPLLLGHSHTPIQSIDYFTAKISASDVPATLQHLQESQALYDADTPFEYHFLDEQIKLFYRNDELTTSLFSIAAGIAVFIACLGLYGLSAFATQQRAREIGIRKVLGASVREILQLLSIDFIKLVGIANLIAWPLVYYLMSLWLNTFAYHQTLGIISFVLAALLLIFVTLITVSGHSFKVALQNPVDSIRHQ